ncbi:polysaccharide export protein [Silicimonas algicola]|uniref:Polysaccharide export outer membrane protein n=1 Tax=Silicimonas algicola TaxID=1826607 RepID=A0A316GF78_9RHOB|nr:polysaccharide biosynthesis/export family protein [Silicimonas algicola]AZQ66534.1 polysaccharide export protein [Silicimonas algicola]PWK58875.1 polysaccharide export outer membrane protein [Silicimonas algicola]
MKKFLVAIAAMLFATVAAAQSGYQIKPGDTLQVEVLEDPSLNRSVLVLPDGTISFPFAGTVRASGRTASDLGSAITSGIASNFASQPNVFVTVQQLSEPTVAATGVATIDVFMMGEIAVPGGKALPRGTTLIQALAETGGFTKFAATKRILLRRTDSRTGQQSVSRINYKAIADGAAVGRDIRLQDGDVIIVPERRLFE